MNENSLIEQYQNSKDLLIRDKLYEQKREILEKFTSSIARSFFPNICLENQDFMSYSYLSFIKCLDNFNTKQKQYTFTQALLTTNKSMIIRYGSKMLQLGHHALNTAYRLEENYDWYSNYASHIDLHENTVREIELEKINEYINRLVKFDRRIIKYKMQGYTNEEISHILHVKPKAVANKYRLICRKYRQHCI